MCNSIWNENCLFWMCISRMGKKAVTKKRLSHDIPSPSLTDWWKIIVDIYKMEELKEFLN